MLKQNILIIDDSQISREILIDMLKDDYNVYEAEDGVEGIQLLEKKPNFFQLILLDLNMPRLDGHGVFRIMQERGWAKEIPVIMISAESGETTKMGVADFLSKPFDQAIVRTRIRNVLTIYERYAIDSLTGGLNRRGFIRQVENFFQNDVKESEYEIFYFNIKNFKAINELIGIENADMLLKQFYQKLLEAEFSPLAVGRLESDHFVCFAKRQDDQYTYLEALCNPKFEYNKKVFQMFIDCGIFHITDKKMRVSAMIDRASLAESLRSDEHTKTYMLYELEMKNTYIDHAELSSELSQSIKNGEFHVYYQPIMDAYSGEIASVEALVRWIHPEKGMISPGIFIPVLEKNGNISQLDMYVVDSVLAFQKERWKKKLPMVPISVNLSGIDLYDEEMMERIKGYVEQNDMPDWTIRFEVTETSYTAMGNRCLKHIHDFREKNIKILMDDFGTGYSSLGLLNDCEIDILKIDRSFINRISKNAKAKNILRAIIDMAHQIGLRVVAEGVETKEQFNYLWLCECDYVQGYYFSYPLPEQDFSKRLDENINVKLKKYEQEEISYVPHFYRVGVHYTSRKMEQTAYADNRVIVDMLHSNDAVGMVSGMYDEKQSICYVCDFCLEMFGVSFDELRNHTNDSYLRLVAEEDREVYEKFEEGVCKYHVVLPNGKKIKIRDMRELLHTKTGEKQWISTLRIINE